MNQENKRVVFISVLIVSIVLITVAAVFNDIHTEDKKRKVTESLEKVQEPNKAVVKAGVYMVSSTILHKNNYSTTRQIVLSNNCQYIQVTYSNRLAIQMNCLKHTH